MLTECLTVTWLRCKGLSMCACKEEGETTWSKWNKRERNLQAVSPYIWMGTEIQHLNFALTSMGHPRFVTAWSTLNPSNWYNHWCLLDTQHWPFPLHCALSVWDINLYLIDAAHKFYVFMVSVQSPPELLEGKFLSRAGFPFNSWVSSSRGTYLEGRKAGGLQGQWQRVPAKKELTSRSEWSIQASALCEDTPKHKLM